MPGMGGRVGSFLGRDMGFINQAFDEIAGRTAGLTGALNPEGTCGKVN